MTSISSVPDSESGLKPRTSLEEFPSPGKVRKNTALIPESWMLVRGICRETRAELQGRFSMKMMASSCSFRYLETE